MSDFTIRTTTTPPATVKVQLDPSQSVAEAVAAADAARADAIQTAADRVQTGLDATATAADRVQTSADASATAADRVQTGEDVIEAAAILASSLKIDQNLADLDNAATARTNLGSTTVGDAVFVAADQAAAQSAIGSPPAARNIATGSGLTGGGDLSADRTLSVSFAANQAEVKTALNAGGSAPIYAARAWVNFNGTGTVAIRASGNVSSITDNGTGDYTVNFTTAMQDANFATTVSVGDGSSVGSGATNNIITTASTVRIITFQTGAGTLVDAGRVSVAVFR